MKILISLILLLTTSNKTHAPVEEVSASQILESTTEPMAIFTTVVEPVQNSESAKKSTSLENDLSAELRQELIGYCDQLMECVLPASLMNHCFYEEVNQLTIKAWLSKNKENILVKIDKLPTIQCENKSLSWNKLYSTLAKPIFQSMIKKIEKRLNEKAPNIKLDTYQIHQKYINDMATAETLAIVSRVLTENQDLFVQNTKGVENFVKFEFDLAKMHYYLCIQFPTLSILTASLKQERISTRAEYMDVFARLFFQSGDVIFKPWQTISHLSVILQIPEMRMLSIEDQKEFYNRSVTYATAITDAYYVAQKIRSTGNFV